MPNFKNFQSSQDQAGQQVTPVAYRWLDEASIGNASLPGQWTPLTMGPDGLLRVRMDSVGPDALILEPDNTSTTPATANNQNVPVNARLYAWDGGTFSRLETRPDDDLAEEALGDEMLETASNSYIFSDILAEWRVRKGSSTPFPFIASSASRAAGATFGPFENDQHLYAHFTVDITVIGVDTLTVNIEALEPVSFNPYTILQSDAFNSTGIKVLKVGPAFTPIANQTANDVIPFDYQVTTTHSGADPITYSIAVAWVGTG